MTIHYLHFPKGQITFLTMGFEWFVKEELTIFHFLVEMSPRRKQFGNEAHGCFQLRDKQGPRPHGQEWFKQQFLHLVSSLDYYCTHYNVIASVTNDSTYRGRV